jgi:hypothetical protein
MKNAVIGIIIIVILSFIIMGSCIFGIYKNFDKMKPSDPLNDDFDEHTDQFVI